jgi:hypothetical protein
MIHDMKFVCTVLCRWELTVFKFFKLVFIFILEDKFFMYIALNTAEFAECSLKPLVISFRCASQAGSLSRLCITSGFLLAACDAVSCV